MKTNHKPAKKSLSLSRETIRTLQSIDLELVRGGEGGDEMAAIPGPTAGDHSCNPACGPA